MLPGGAPPVSNPAISPAITPATTRAPTGTAIVVPSSHLGPAHVSTVRVMSGVSILPVVGLPEIEQGADLAAMVAEHEPLADGDIVVITSKIVSKAEGCAVDLDEVVPSSFAVDWGSKWDKDPRVVEVVLRESARIVRQIGPVLITETHHGFVCANAGVDQSSSGAHTNP